MSTMHLAVVVDYDQGAILASDIEQAIEEFFGRSRNVQATAVIVSETLHGRLLAVRKAEAHAFADTAREALEEP
jgi:hypothetical protein